MLRITGKLKCRGLHNQYGKKNKNHQELDVVKLKKKTNFFRDHLSIFDIYIYSVMALLVNCLGFFEDDFDDFNGGYGPGPGFGSGGGGMNRRGPMGMRQQQQRGRMNMMGGEGGMGPGMGGRMGGGGGGGMGGGMGGSGMGGGNRQRGATPGSHYVSRTGHSVHMRGLPFQALESDIADVSLLL